MIALGKCHNILIFSCFKIRVNTKMFHTFTHTWLRSWKRDLTITAAQLYQLFIRWLTKKQIPNTSIASGVRGRHLQTSRNTFLPRALVTTCKQNRFIGDYISCIIPIKLYDFTQFKIEILTARKIVIYINYIEEYVISRGKSIGTRRFIMTFSWWLGWHSRQVEIPAKLRYFYSILNHGMLSHLNHIICEKASLQASGGKAKFYIRKELKNSTVVRREWMLKRWSKMVFTHTLTYPSVISNARGRG